MPTEYVVRQEDASTASRSIVLKEMKENAAWLVDAINQLCVDIV